MMDRWTDAVGLTWGATALAVVCAQGPLNLQKVFEEKDFDSSTTALKSKSLMIERG